MVGAYGIYIIRKRTCIYNSAVIYMVGAYGLCITYIRKRTHIYNSAVIYMVDVYGLYITYIRKRKYIYNSAVISSPVRDSILLHVARVQR